MPLYVKVDCTAGDSIEDTAVEMCELARRLDLQIRVEFNGVTLIARPGGLAKVLIEGFRDSLDSKFKVVVA